MDLRLPLVGETQSLSCDLEGRSGRRADHEDLGLETARGPESWDGRGGHSSGLSTAEGDTVVAREKPGVIAGKQPGAVLHGAHRDVLIGVRPPRRLASALGQKVADEVFNLPEAELQSVGLLAFEVGLERIVFSHRGEVAQAGPKINSPKTRCGQS